MSTTDWSLPETDVFDRIRTALDDGADAVLATVIAVEGSAYRRPGAKMLLDPDGGGAGSITAGCLEDEVRALADDVLADGSPRVETWDLTGDDDVWGLGVGCNGVITVLLEPLDDSFRPVVDARLAGEEIGVATVVGRDGGTDGDGVTDRDGATDSDGDADVALGDRAYYRPDEGFAGHGSADGGLADGGLADRSLADDCSAGDDLPETLFDELAVPTRDLVAAGSAETLSVDAAGERVEVFVDGVGPPPELVVFGSGHDVAPVVEVAKRADFRVTVVSFRGGRADADRFPRADDVVSASPRDVGDLREWDADTYAVVMSHNFLDDRLALGALLDTPVEYVGLMGPKERFDEMREAFAEEDRPLADADLDRVYTPIGLSLGGDSPSHVAFSIVSELLAVAHDRTPRHLSRRDGPIHDRPDVETE